MPNLKEFHRRKVEKSDKDFSIFSPQWQLRHQNRNSPRSLCEHARIFESRGFVEERLQGPRLLYTGARMRVYAGLANHVVYASTRNAFCMAIRV